jgi:hypothetical protein
VEYDEGPAGVVERRGRGAEIESKKYAQKRAQIFSSRPEDDPLPPERGVKSGEGTQVMLGRRTKVKKEVEAGIIDYVLRRRFHPAFLLSRQQSESRPTPLSQFDWSLQLTRFRHCSDCTTTTEYNKVSFFMPTTVGKECTSNSQPGSIQFVWYHNVTWKIAQAPTKTPKKQTSDESIIAQSNSPQQQVGTVLAADTARVRVR